jgi:hypothetical protein
VVGRRGHSEAIFALAVPAWHRTVHRTVIYRVDSKLRSRKHAKTPYFKTRRSIFVLIVPYRLTVLAQAWIYHMYSRQFKHVLVEYDLRNQRNPPFSKLHIELLKQFEGSRTFTDFIEPLLPKNELNNPGSLCMVQASPTHTRTCAGSLSRVANPVGSPSWGCCCWPWPWFGCWSSSWEGCLHA